MQHKRIIVLFAAAASAGLAFIMASTMGASNNIQAQLPTPSEFNTVDVLVTAQPIEVGQTIADTALEWRPWPEDFVADNFIVSDEMPDAISEFTGKISRADLAPDEPIIEATLFGSRNVGFMASMLEEGQRAMSIAIEPETTANGFVLPGDHVDILLSRPVATGGGDSYYAETILQDVLVLAIDDRVFEEGSPRSILGSLATLAVTNAQAETLGAAVRLGTVSLILRGIDEQVFADNEPACRKNRAIRRIRVIRFGKDSYQVVNTDSCADLRR